MTEQNNQKTIASYNEAVQAYIDGSSKSVQKGLYEEWLHAALSGLKLGGRIFEIGSADGIVAKFFESRGFQVQRSDAASGFVDYMRAQGYDAKEFDVLTDTMPTSYDMVFAKAILVHFTKDECKKVMESVYKALPNGGRFVCDVKEGVGEGWSNEKLDKPRFFSHWSRQEFDHALKQSGFKRVDISYRKSSRATQRGWFQAVAFR